MSQRDRYFYGLLTIIMLPLLCGEACAQTTPMAAPAVATPTSMSAPNGHFIVMPTGRKASRRSGLFLFLDTRWVDGYGYRPIEVTISAPKPTKASHEITVQLHWGWTSDIAVEQEFELPPGAAQASTKVAMPIYEQSVHCFWWTVWVDGVKDRDLSIDKDDAVRTWGLSNVSRSNFSVLVPGDESSHRTLFRSSAMDFEVLSLKLADFPRRWINYTSFDVVSLSTSELQSLAKSNPPALEAMERWVRAGGQLWVTDVGTQLRELPQVSKLLNVSDAIVGTGTKTGATKTSNKSGDKTDGLPIDSSAEIGWRPAQNHRGMRAGQPHGFTDRSTGQTRWVVDPKVIAELERDPNFAPASPTGQPGDENSPRWWAADSSQWFVEQPIGFGRVRAFRGSNDAAHLAHNGPIPMPGAAINAGQNDPIPRALAMALRSTRQWEARHGILPDSGNPEFAKLLVPGVGLAPVTEFQILITLFVLVIGPFNYWILKRYKRLQLLVITVPLAAVVTTVALFAYAIVSDGFATRVRVRSFTTLDHRTGEAATWARLSYYSGLAPGQGLTMPADVALYPILPSWSGESLDNRELVWNGDKQRLTRGWLNSRTPTQYLSLRSRSTSNRLDVKAGNGKMRVTNRLGTSIESLIALDESGKFFVGEQLANGSSATLQRVARDEAVKRIVELVRNNELEAPTALADSDRDFLGRHRRGAQAIFGRYRPPLNEDRTNEDLASRALSDLAGLNGQPALDLPPRSYVAITSTGPEVETGVPDARQVASFHVVVGQW
ncbi:MAG TPA: hypothetical protein VFW73_02220 [Lacipirellulaceae bacterium]|nr:hypothetical protein [Lacipirellulaceae bacterium]